MMYFALFLFVILIILALLLYYRPALVNLQLHSELSQSFFILRWLDPLLKAEVKIIDAKPSLSVYFLGIRVYSKNLNAGFAKNKNTSYARALVLHSTHVNAYYGFSSPFYTGLAIGLIEYIQMLFGQAEIQQYPDFLCDDEYMIVTARSELNMGKTAANILRMKFTRQKTKRREYYGSVQSH